MAYLHISDNPSIPQKTHQAIRSAFSNTLIYYNGLTPQTAEAKLQDGSADLVAFARSVLANPDFMSRIGKKAPLNEVDYTTLYIPGVHGYTDYPVWDELTQLVSPAVSPAGLFSQLNNRNQHEKSNL